MNGLPKTMVDFGDDMIAEGNYSSSNKVVRKALRLHRHEQATRREKAVILRREVSAGLENAVAGLFSN